MVPAPSPEPIATEPAGPAVPRGGTSIGGAALPVPLSSFVGRAREVTDVVALLRRADVRLVTITGPGGVGKTRLAIEAAGAAREGFAGLAFIPLAAIREAPHLLPAIAQALRVPGGGVGTTLDRLRAALATGPTLLVLDNLEHVLPAAASAIAGLLTRCPMTAVLATSRELIHVSGEHVVPLAPLPLPQPGRANAPSAWQESDAVLLFAERAAAVRPGFAVTAANADTIGEICRRLDGLPLAIELAAARCRILPPPAMLARLDRRLALLGAGAPDLPARLQTLRAAIAWSHDLLTAEEQTLFRRLAVFAGGFTLEAAEAVMERLGASKGSGDGQGREEVAPTSPGPLAPSPPSVLDGLSSLVDKSLVGHDTLPGHGLSRYALLETIREFGRAQLALSGDEGAVAEAHARYFLAVAEEVDGRLAAGADPPSLDPLELERDNLSAAVDWFVEAGAAEQAVRLATALWRPWEILGHPRQSRVWLERALATPGSVPPALRARALNNLGNVLLDLDDPAAADRYEQSLALRRGLGDRAGVADTLNNLGLLALAAGRFDDADDRLRESLAIRRALADRAGEALALSNLGDLAIAVGDFERAWALHEEALTIRQALGQPRPLGYSELNLAEVALARGELSTAAEQLERALGRFRAVGDRVGTALVHHQRGRLALGQQDLPRAVVELVEALERRWAVGDRRGAADSLATLATVAASTGDDERAVRLFAGAEAMADVSRHRVDAPPRRTQAAATERALAALLDCLGEPAFKEAHAAGRRLRFDEIVAEAAQIAPSSPPPSQRPARSAPVTPREADVLRLVARGLSNAEVAARLSLSPATINAHLTRIYHKLAVSSRDAAIRKASELGLT